MKKKQTVSHLITPEQPVLVLRVCNHDMSAYGGFVWPTTGLVTCPDWKDEPECGNGLHGWLWGEGNHAAAQIRQDSKWLVVKVAAYIELQGKVKYPEGEVVFCGGKLEATTYLAANGGQGRAIICGTATAGYAGTATAGYAGTATAGHAGTATAGYAGTATAGYAGTATAGDRGTLFIKRWNGKHYKFYMANVGENGIKPNVAYKLDDEGNFIEA